EGLFQRHFDRALLGQCGEDALRLARSVDLNGHGTAFDAFKGLPRRRVGAHQDLAADDEAGMHELSPGVGGHVCRMRRVTEGDHCHDLSAQTPFVELERRLALAIEGQVRIPLKHLNSQLEVMQETRALSQYGTRWPLCGSHTSSRTAPFTGTGRFRWARRLGSLPRRR